MTLKLKNEYSYLLYYTHSEGSIEVKIEFPVLITDIETIKEMGRGALIGRMDSIPKDLSFLKYEVTSLKENTFTEIGCQSLI